MQVTSLASGSSGNCYLVQAANQNILIDCGLTVTNLKKYLAEMNLQPTDLSAIFLTHDHGDHVRGAGSVSRQFGVPVIGNSKTLEQARYRWQKVERLEEQRANMFGGQVERKHKNFNIEILPTGEAKAFGALEVSSFPVSHDAAETVCYTFRAEGQQAVILTDLGCATGEIFEPLNASQLIILEANHDLDTLRKNPKYSYALKARIEGSKGHLSNAQSAAILRQVLEKRECRARSGWLTYPSIITARPMPLNILTGNSSTMASQSSSWKWQDATNRVRFGIVTTFSSKVRWLFRLNLLTSSRYNKNPEVRLGKALYCSGWFAASYRYSRYQGNVPHYHRPA